MKQIRKPALDSTIRAGSIIVTNLLVIAKNAGHFMAIKVLEFPPVKRGKRGLGASG
jgi:hypothetical protein